MHAEDGTVEEDVFPAREFGMEASADFEEATDLAIQSDAASSGSGDAAEELQEGGLPRPVPSNQADDFSFFHFKGNVFEAPEFFVFAFFVAGGEPTADAPDKIFSQGRVAIGGIFPGSGFDAVALGEVLDFDHALGLSWPPWESWSVTRG